MVFEPFIVILSETRKYPNLQRESHGVGFSQLSPAERTGVQRRAPEGSRRPTDKLVSCNVLGGSPNLVASAKGAHSQNDTADDSHPVTRGVGPSVREETSV